MKNDHLLLFLAVLGVAYIRIAWNEMIKVSHVVVCPMGFNLLCDQANREECSNS